MTSSASSRPCLAQMKVELILLLQPCQQLLLLWLLLSRSASRDGEAYKFIYDSIGEERLKNMLDAIGSC